MIKTCLICGKSFKVRGKRKLTAKYCSSKCYWDNKHDIPWNKGKKTGLIPKTAFKKGLAPWNKGKKGIMPIPWNKNIKFDAIRGINHWNWKGGKPKTNRRETMTYGEYRKYLDWQKSVFKRDNWDCQKCGKHGGTLHADHIKSWALFPELRLKLSNGRTLCPPCHTKTDSYGRGLKYLLSSS